MYIRQRYFGFGGPDGYEFMVIKDGKEVGELTDVPSVVGIGDILKLDGMLYKVRKEESLDDEVEEVRFHLERYEFTDYFELEWTV